MVWLSYWIFIKILYIFKINKININYQEILIKIKVFFNIKRLYLELIKKSKKK